MNVQSRFRRSYSPALARLEIAVNLAAVVACWKAVSFLWMWSVSAYRTYGVPPTTLDGLRALAESPAALAYAEAWALSVLAATVGVPLAWSAGQGTWWIVKRLSRPF